MMVSTGRPALLIGFELPSTVDCVCGAMFFPVVTRLSTNANDSLQDGTLQSKLRSEFDI
jgi:hypothetical protein